MRSSTRIPEKVMDQMTDEAVSARRRTGSTFQPAAGHLARHGHVRPRRRHVHDERFHLRGGARPWHDSQRRPVRDRARGPGVGRLHPDRQQDRRSVRAEACVRARSARLCHRGSSDDPGPRTHRDHHLLGDHRRHRRLPPAARHAVTDPRKLRRQRPKEGLRLGRGGSRHRSGCGPPARRLHHHIPVLAGGLRPRSGDHRDRAFRHQAGT